MSRRPRYETDDAAFPADAYRVDRWDGIAWYVYGWETEPDEDTEWSGYERRTGRVVAVMVGDDRRFSFDPSEVHPLEREAYCAICGQIGCGHDGLDRSEAAS
jgi:hypothetical protein